MLFPNQNTYDSLIVTASNDQSLSFALIKAIIAQESNFVATAYRAEPSVNDASYGLMQLLGATAAGLGYTGSPTGLYDPATNINLGSQFLAGLVQTAANNGWGIDSAISAYNAGFSSDRPGDGKRNTDRTDGYLDDGSALAPFVNQAYVNAVYKYMADFAGGPGTFAGSAAPASGLSTGETAALVIGGLVLLGVALR